MLFGNNDRPGVMLGSAVRTYVNRFAASPGHRTVVFTSSDDGLSTARDLEAAGLSVEAVIDSRPGHNSQTMNGAPIFSGSQIIRTFGSQGVQAVEVMDSYGNIRLIDCDSVAMSNGWVAGLYGVKKRTHLFRAHSRLVSQLRVLLKATLH